MTIKRIIFICAILGISGLSFAQTQLGYVKTIGRPNKPGMALSGVTIRMKGSFNAVVSSATGEFQLLAPGKKDGDAIMLLSIQKTGYELKDKELTGLIGDMADRYARTDYDQLDSIDREINICIENGDLDRADSLIHTVFDPETVLERNRAAKAEIQQRIAFAQSIIDKANADKEAILRDMEYAKRVAQLCDNLAEEYIVQGKQNKARECLEKSLEIKTILYGEQSQEVIDTNRHIKTIRQ